MSTNPPAPGAPEQRMLAAVVFTDVTGYTARMQKEETATLELLKQDFAAMRSFAAELSGTVLKSTGDGLLLYFTSAVNAVTWALKSQRHFAERTRGDVIGDALRHRVGVHVGDVIVRADDVVGDGVNIAARVQTQAPPGGICISQAAYAMVQNKMELHVVRLEPRKLKNVSENVQMYHVLLEEPVRQSFALTPTVERAPEIATDEPASRSRPLVAAVAVVLAVAVGVWAMRRMFYAHEEDLAQSQVAQAQLDAALAKRASGAKETASAPAAPAVAIDFAKLTTAQPRGGAASAKDEVMQRQASEGAAAADAWVRGQLSLYTRDHALLVRDLRDGMQSWTIYTDTNGQLVFAKGAGATRAREWETLGAELQGAIIATLVRNTSGGAPPTIMRDAEAFAFVNGLPEMAAELMRARRASAPP